MRQKMSDSGEEDQMPPTILKKTWLSLDGKHPDDRSTQSPRTITFVSATDSETQSEREKSLKKPKKKVSFSGLSDFRRQSLTGSLPDLAKASDKDLEQCSDNLRDKLQISREPLPEASTIFQKAMVELSSDSDSDGKDSSSDDLSHSWNGGLAHHTNGKKFYVAGDRQFESKAAALIYSRTRNSLNSKPKSISVNTNSKKVCSQKSHIDTCRSPRLLKDNGNKVPLSSPIRAKTSQLPKSANGSQTSRAPFQRQASVDSRLQQRTKPKHRLTKSTSVD